MTQIMPAALNTCLGTPPAAADLCYNFPMTHLRAQTDISPLLPIAVGLWAGYLLVLALMDLLVFPQPVFGPAVYLANSLAALCVLGLTVWRQGRRRLGRFFLPLVIGLLTLVPLVTGNLASLTMRPVPGNGLEAVTLRLMPLLLIGLVITAWQYGWNPVAIYTCIIAVFTLVLQFSFFRPGGPSLAQPLTVLAMQTATFLVVGYFISLLIRRLQLQQQKLADANAQLVNYAAALEELTVSRERNRMARELHDTLAHTLSGVAVQLETVKAYWDVDQAAARSLLDDSLDSTRAGLVETRRALKALRASPLDDLGLAQALRQLAVETAERANLALQMAVPEQIAVFSPPVEQCVYRVAQEAVANVAQHAQARTLTVRLAAGSTAESPTVLLVRDDGIGFDADTAAPAGHFGLAGIRERARLVGGELAVTSRQGHGTEVLLSIPGDPWHMRDLQGQQAERVRS